MGKLQITSTKLQINPITLSNPVAFIMKYVGHSRISQFVDKKLHRGLLCGYPIHSG